MHVLAVSQSYFPYLNEGGRPTKVRAIAAGLTQRGHQVTVLTAHLGPLKSPTSDSAFLARPCEFGYCAHDGGINVVYLRSVIRRRTVTLNAGLLRFCRTALSDVDVVHIFGIYDFIGPVVAAYCRRAGIPYVVETMGMFRPFSRSILGKRAYHRLLGRTLIGGAARVIATSDRERSELLEGRVPAARIVVRPNGVEPPPALVEGVPFRERFRLPRDARIVFFLGRIARLKSPDMLLRAFSRVLEVGRRSSSGEHLHLLIAGPPEESRYYEELVELAQTLGIAESVTFAPPLYGPDKWHAYRASSVFVLPSTSENFGNAAAEAITAGTPVIVTDRCGIASFINSTRPQPGIVIPHDEDELTGVLLKVSNSDSLLQELKAGCQIASKSLGWEAPLARLEELYGRLTA